MKLWLSGASILLIVCLWMMDKSENSSGRVPSLLTAKVVGVHPHDKQAFTQGLIVHDARIYESTGLYKRSSLREIDRKTGKILRLIPLPDRWFGEGLTRANKVLVQLTYKEEIASVYDLATLSKIKQFRYSGEGWGLCFDGKRLIMSDGSDQLTFRDPATFGEVGRLLVNLNGEPQDRLNELEYVNGSLYANIFGTDTIARIDPNNGTVTAIVDASGLLTPEERNHSNVLNGIAYDHNTKTFLLTGKFWPHLFEVVFVPKN